MSKTNPQEWYRRAVAAEQAGEPDQAVRLMSAALEEHPKNPDLLNAAGNLAMRMELPALAADRFAEALQCQPGSMEIAINHAIALTAIDRPRHAIEVIAPFDSVGATNARFCSARAAAERAMGRLDRSAAWYDRTLAANPNHVRGLHGRARVALERGEDEAVARYDAALELDSSDPVIWLGKAQALDAAGDHVASRRIAKNLVDQAPAWIDGLDFLAQLRRAAGEQDFTSHYRAAQERVPSEPAVALAHIATLAGCDQFGQAAEIAAEARRRHPDEEVFALLEASHASAAGDVEQAEDIFSRLTGNTVERAVEEARHALRRAEFDRASKAIERVLDEEPGNVIAWALRGVLWRVTDDSRSRWLHEQAGLVQFLPLENFEIPLPRLSKLLESLHDLSAQPLGQSLRGGTQTRAAIFNRTEDELAQLRTAIDLTLKQYRRGLPPRDESHPLLRFRDDEWAITGSWSVRLFGGGDHHTAHVHPRGIISSALYIALPQSADDRHRQGWLELGRPPPDLRLDLPPLREIQPREGYLALFPSTLYHSTVAFDRGRRLTVAFDVGGKGDIDG